MELDSLMSLQMFQNLNLIMLMFDIRTKAIEEIDQLLKNLSRHDTDPETMTAKIGLIREKLKSLNDKVKTSSNSFNDEMKKKDKKYRNLYEQLRILEEKNKGCEIIIKEHQKLVAYVNKKKDKKEKITAYRNLKFERQLQKKMIALKRVKELKVINLQLQERLLAYEKVISQNKVALDERRQTQQQIFQKVFERLKKVMGQPGNVNYQQRRPIPERSQPQPINSVGPIQEEANQEPQQDAEEEEYDQDDEDECLSYCSQTLQAQQPEIEELKPETDHVVQVKIEETSLKDEQTEINVPKEEIKSPTSEMSLVGKLVQWIWHLNRKN